MRNLMCLLFLAGVSLSSQVVGDDKTDADDLKTLSGTWTLVAMEINGKKLPAEGLKDVTAVVKGDKVTVSHKGEVKSAAKFTIDSGKKPKTMDATALQGPNKGKKSLAIYELDADTFKICSSEGETRPKSFAAKEGSGFSLMVWKRAK